MKIAIRLSVMAVAMGLVACGGGAKLGGGKQGAAQAAAQASQAATSAYGTGGALAASGADTINITVEGKCSQGGTASYTLSGTGDPSSENYTFNYTFKMSGCSADGKNFFSGDLTMGWKVNVPDSGTSFSYEMRMNGSLTISGAVADTLTITDYVQVMNLTTSGSSYSYDLTVSGTVATSSGSYTYANEHITASGDLPTATADTGNDTLTGG